MFKHWISTAFGVGFGAVNLWANGVSWKQILVSIAGAGIGAVVPDWNKVVTPPAVGPKILK